MSGMSGMSGMSVLLHYCSVKRSKVLTGQVTVVFHPLEHVFVSHFSVDRPSQHHRQLRLDVTRDEFFVGQIIHHFHRNVSPFTPLSLGRCRTKRKTRGKPEENELVWEEDVLRIFVQ